MANDAQVDFLPQPQPEVQKCGSDRPSCTSFPDGYSHGYECFYAQVRPRVSVGYRKNQHGLSSGLGPLLSEDLVHWLLFWGNVALIMRVREKLVHRRKVALMLAKANVSSIWSRQLVSNQGLIDIS